MEILFHPHALDRMSERGTTEDEVRRAIEFGGQFLARFGRTGFRRNFTFDSQWHEKYYHTKQLEIYAVKEDDHWLVITVITKYF
ncbi:TPA: DUF4258 domain-containing protein [bacterium]|nr:DUF4258 domain-containing protein [bacterium]